MGDNITFFFAVFFLILIRFLYFGFEYYPQLDDYIQHHNYAQLVEQMFDGNMGEFIKWIGLLSARPLAGLLDITLWSWLWPCAIIGVILACLGAETITLEVVAGGLLSGLASTGLHQAFKQIIENI